MNRDLEQGGTALVRPNVLPSLLPSCLLPSILLALSSLQDRCPPPLVPRDLLPVFLSLHLLRFHPLFGPDVNQSINHPSFSGARDLDIWTMCRPSFLVRAVYHLLDLQLRPSPPPSLQPTS